MMFGNLASSWALVLSTCLTTVRCTFPITGAQSGGVQPRLEISDMYYKHPDQFNLYILSLQAFQAQSQSSQLSYYGVSGIHGAPNQTWDGVGPTSSGQGYCNHANNLFAPWHRPYIALFEQRLSASAHVIAGKFPAGATRTQYQKVAAILRQPYWDWARKPQYGQQTFYSFFTAQTISVTTPTGKQTINNPLYSYYLGSADSNGMGSPWSAWPNTLRYPTSLASNAGSQDGDDVNTFIANRPGQCSGLYQFFTNCPTFSSTHDYNQHNSPSCGPTLESLHNNVHDWTGGLMSNYQDGHMTVIPYSAFDPVFMLHHTQIDRLFALWQAIYPDAWCANQVSYITTYTIQNGSIQGPDSPLTPFHKDSHGTPWTSNDCRKWTVLNYTYPEFVGNNGSPETIVGKVTALYGGSQCQNSDASTTKRDAKSSMAKPRGSSASSITPLLASNGSSYQYFANIQTTRFGLNGSYLVSMFLGSPASEDPSTWVTDPSFVGSTGVFSMPGMTDSRIVTNGRVALTDPLSEKISNAIIPTLEEAVVVPFLASNLQWRVVGPTGLYNPDNIPDFLVTVFASTLKPAANDGEFPTWSTFIPLPEVTKGKAGGLQL